MCLPDITICKISIGSLIRQEKRDIPKHPYPVSTGGNRGIEETSDQKLAFRD
jgi:hypothetical protein